jgi:hypothetical protein
MFRYKHHLEKICYLYLIFTLKMEGEVSAKVGHYLPICTASHFRKLLSLLTGQWKHKTPPISTSCWKIKSYQIWLMSDKSSQPMYIGYIWDKRWRISSITKISNTPIEQLNCNYINIDKLLPDICSCFSGAIPLLYIIQWVNIHRRIPNF